MTNTNAITTSAIQRNTGCYYGRLLYVPLLLLTIFSPDDYCMFPDNRLADGAFYGELQCKDLHYVCVT